ncbi:MAG: ABC transporter substrate-binding protein [Gemmatimonadota bacterium]|nr:ABC transporter substrate-binding protein [Gemmatimonadota bacterium]
MPRPSARSARSPLLLVLPCLALACRGAPPDTTARRTLVDSRDTYDPRSLDPALSTDVPTGRAVSYVYEGLTRFTPDARLEPALAERWDVSPDGRTYTFHLRAGVRFQDGTPLTARDVVHSFTRALDPATHGGRADPLLPIRGAAAVADGKATVVAGLAAPDDSTVVVTLDRPLAIFPKLLAMPVASVLPAGAPAAIGDHPVGTGPWKLVRWKHDDYLLFARNPDYWGGPAESDSLEARIIAEPSTAVAEFEAGNVDVTEIPPDEMPSWEADSAKRRRLVSGPSLQLVYVAINTTRGPLRDVRVRQAINDAVDTKTILARLLHGQGRVAAGVIPPALGGADTTRAPYPYDPAKARALLAAAGYPAGIDVQLWTGATPVMVRVAEAIQAYLDAVGIRTKIEQRDYATASQASRRGETDLFLKDWYADYPDAEDFLDPLLGSQNAGLGGNVSFYRNPSFDALMARARVETDAGRRDALYRSADSLAFADAPMLYLYFYDHLFAVQPWIRGFTIPVIFNGQRWTHVSIARGPAPR